MSHKPISSKTMANSKHLSLYFSIEYHLQLASLKIYILELNKSYAIFFVHSLDADLQWLENQSLLSQMVLSARF